MEGPASRGRCRAALALASLVLAAAAPAAGPAPLPLVFFATADWGGEEAAPYTTPGQLAAAHAMGTVSAEAGSHPAFVLAAGDNFYMDGIPGPLPNPVTVTRVASTFQDVYTAAGLQVPWYFVGGNHDWVGDIQAEVALNGSAATGGRWNMPATYYTFQQSLPGGGETVQFVMVDTETLFGGLNPTPPVLPSLGYPYANTGVGSRRSRASRKLAQSSEGDPGADSPLDPPVPTSWVPPPVDEVQWAWVASVLNASTADWLIVVGHHPVWSVGAYGPTWMLVERLLPLMESAGVALYICGHEHMMEHFRSEPHATGVDFLVVGNGAYWNDTAPEDTEHATSCPEGALQYQYAEGTGFASLIIAAASPSVPSQLSVTLYDSSAAQLYSFIKQNPRGPAIKGRRRMAGRTLHRALLALLLVVCVPIALLIAGRLAQEQLATAPRPRASAPRRAPQSVGQEGDPLLSSRASAPKRVVR